MPTPNPLLSKVNWIESGDIRPYVFVRPENQIAHPGTRHKLDWFSHTPIYKDPLDISELNFADRIYSIEERAFGPSNMAMPRWVFYDCAVMPGFVAGFAARPSALKKEVRDVLDLKKFPASDSPVFKSTEPRAKSLLAKSLDEMDWVPLSLFIIIPTMHKGEWVAHNLCSVNSLLAKEHQFYGLGFLSKAFGLWYANVEQCSGMTQWGSPALKLHTHFGHLEVIGSYAPVHSHSKTITYRAQVNTRCWEQFFTREDDLAFLENYGPSELQIDPKNEQSMIDIQKKLELGEGPFYLNAMEIAAKNLDESLTIYKPKGY
ncbi:MAG: hypothetical protein IPM97_03800 [Bdellovibrionaceae bacterium]|nr:hypothetical protein [Pseudobdellovibrionaceae bacterium]